MHFHPLKPFQKSIFSNQRPAWPATIFAKISILQCVLGSQTYSIAFRIMFPLKPYPFSEF